jgi:3-oxoacyl-[acyl-carrier-protein] synthase II
MSQRRVVVTGLGAVSFYGLGVDTFWQSTLAGKTCVGPITCFDPSLYRSGLGAQIPESIRNDAELRARHGNPAEDATFYAAMATAEALADAGLDENAIAKHRDRIGCVVGTLCSSARNYEALGRAHLDGTLNEGLAVAEWPPVGPMLIEYQLRFLCDFFGLDGPGSLVSTACASGTDAIAYGFDMVRLGQADMAVVAGGDIISEVIHGGFNSVFAVTRNVPRPFDRDRDGFVIGEGGGAMVIETLESALARNARIYAEVKGYGLSNSASHLTAPSKDGTGEALAMQRALDSAGIGPDEVDFVNAHGTGTQHNDRTEVLALKLVFGDHAPAISMTSLKSMIGHCMGVAGMLEAISTVKSIQTSLLPPTINFREPEDINPFDVVANVARERPVRNALTNSFGFGGHDASVVFASVDAPTMSGDTK